MPLPRVAIVGRPNVGKSSIFNWLAGRLISIVDPTAGVTRDRLTYICREKGRYFEIVDTGGIGIIDSDELEADIEKQIRYGIEQADVILFVVDARTGKLPHDDEVAKLLRGRDIPKILVINKCDSAKYAMEQAEFLGLADAPVVLTSVKGNENRSGLFAAIVKALPPAAEDEATFGEAQITEPEMKLAIVGRRNVGKSTFINAIAEEERVIVSEVAGTTRDSIDVRFEGDGRSFIAIDTPGVRRKKSLEGDIEFYSLVRAQKSIRRADVVLMFLSATETISKVDKNLIEEIGRYYKPCIFVINKWDLGTGEEMTTEKWTAYIGRTFPTLSFMPVAFVTAQEGRNVRPVINLAQSIFKQARVRVSTGKLNSIVRDAIDRQPPPMKKNRRPKIFFATQVSTEPPTIVLKCNDPKLFTDSWTRYLMGKLRDAFPFDEVPVKLILRARDAEQSEEKYSTDRGNAARPVKSRRSPTTRPSPKRR
ncbi:ribosome biogenesis GTPase Der [Stratiformator vulcanicus]|uniref:GTPase Der n=1 Tax=Stratiformator vulcanicus TaxID=2527980 RepID=A0A517R3H1_9PLAN|nr:ribosome biogenesis GTPase Der [Stratiformator vulcanicus]QDT38432.1 GTPase Der [Stratiformator vulcanicus]